MDILIIKPTALGDVAQAIPAVSALAKGVEKARVSWVVDESYGALLDYCPWLHEKILFPRKKLLEEGLAESWRWFKSLSERGNFDLVLDLQGLARSGVMVLFTKAGRKIGLRSAREGSRFFYGEEVDDRGEKSAPERYLRACQHVAGRNIKLTMDPAPCERSSGSKLPVELQAGHYTVLHPYSIWATKLWGWENFCKLIESAPEEMFVLVGNGIAFPAPQPNVLDMRNRTGLEELIALLSNARCVISTDSGPLHIAALFDVPLVSLFMSTDPTKTAPVKKHRILAAGVPCAPCLSRYCHHGVSPHACSRSITFDLVLDAWREITAMSKL